MFGEREASFYVSLDAPRDTFIRHDLCEIFVRSILVAVHTRYTHETRPGLIEARSVRERLARRISTVFTGKGANSITI